MYEHTPFGSFSRHEPADAPNATSHPHFTGKRLDSSTGLYYFGARYYDPELGRFIQPDSIVQAPSDPQTLNRYTYVRNNPLIYTDPTGHSFWRKIKSFFKAAAAIIIGVVVTIATGGFAAPAALAWGGFAAGFSGTLINGGSFGQAVGMGLVGAFAGGVGGVAFGGLKDIARIAALTAIGATAGAAGSAIMGRNIGLGAAAGAAAGFLGGAVGGRLADKWNPGLARNLASMATAAGGGAAGAAIAGGSPGSGAALGAFSVAVAIAAGSLQDAIDAGRAKAAEKGAALTGADGVVAAKTAAVASGQDAGTGGISSVDSQPEGALDVDNALRLAGRLLKGTGVRALKNLGKATGIFGNIIDDSTDAVYYGRVIGGGVGALGGLWITKHWAGALAGAAAGGVAGQWVAEQLYPPPTYAPDE